MKTIGNSVLILLFGIIATGIYAQENQNKMAGLYEDISYKVIKVIPPKKYKGKHSTELQKRAWPISFHKGVGTDEMGNTVVDKVIVNRAGVIEEEFVPDLKQHPAYFRMESTRLTFLKNKAYYYTWKHDQATIKYIFCESCSSADYEKEKAALEQYVLATFAKQKNARQGIAEEKKVLAAAERAAFSLKDKKLKSIAITNLEIPSDLGHKSDIGYGITATLADGRVFKTTNLGGKTSWDDFNIKVEGAQFGEEKVTVYDNCDKIPYDEVVIKVSSKYHPSIQAIKRIPINYNRPISVYHQGKAGGVVGLYVTPGVRGGNGANINVYAKQVSHQQTHEPLIQYEIQYKGSGKVLHRLKMSPSTQLMLYVDGGAGSGGRDGKSQAGGAGGNGGNVTLIKDPNVRTLSFNVSMNGGRGGKGGKPYGKQGDRGLSGSYDQRVSSVNMAW